MTAGGVIPPHIQELGTVKDVDGFGITVCTEGAMVRLEAGRSVVVLGRSQAEEFAQLFVRACWEVNK